MLRYSLPMVVIGMAGIVNEMLDRAALKYLLPYDDATNMAQLGIYSACYKLSILMTLFIQAFRYAGEPFFFSYAKQRDAKQLYALVLNWFVIFCVFIFLLVTLYIDLFQYFVGAPTARGSAWCRCCCWRTCCSASTSTCPSGTSSPTAPCWAPGWR
jgi:O-antigen/teichoic acid export membrane protein